MGRLVNWIYGGVLIFLAVDALWIPIIPRGTFLAFLVLAMGVVVMMTPLGPGPGYGGVGYVPASRPRLQFLRRWFFGAFLVLMGLISIPIIFGIIPYPIGAFLYNISLNSFTGPLLMALIGLIYMLAGSERARGMEIRAH